MNTPAATASSRGKIVELRALLAEKFPTAPAQELQTIGSGCRSLDDALGDGGLLRGRVTEIVRPRAGAGAAFVLSSMIRGTAERGGRLALVDSQDSFDPDGLENSELRRLLWVRCRGADMATKAADWLLRDGNLPVVVLDLVGASAQDLRRIPASTWYRLASAAESHGSSCLALTPMPLAVSATVRLELRGRYGLDAISESRDVLEAQLEWGCLRRRETRLPSESNIVPFAQAVA